MRSTILSVAAVVGALTVACGGSRSPSADTALVSSPLARDTRPASTGADQATLAADNTRFAFDLYQANASATPSVNLAFSPYSVSVALAMTYAGANAQTKTQIASTLHFDNLSDSNLHAAFDAVDLALASRATGNQGAGGQPFRLTVANSLWGDRKLRFQRPFLDTLAVDYGAGVRVVDFAGAPESARQAINHWVSDETAGKVPDLLAQGAIKSNTAAALINAVLFDAAWGTPFDKQVTASATFTRQDGSTVPIQMMGTVEPRTTSYAETAAYQAVELTYAGGQTSMVVVLPAAGQFAAVESGMSADFFVQLTASLASTPVQLYLPKFAIHGATISLKTTLSALGMPDAFDRSVADFSAMTGQRDLWIDNILHQASVTVDEVGTVAAGATAVVYARHSAVLGLRSMTVDRPFLFFIRDVPTNVLLFAGRVTDPSAQ
jgi:serpin B